MKLNKSIMALATAAAFGISGQAFAVNGTLSGTTISNTASLSYKVNSVDQTAIENSADFKVATRVDFTLSTPDATSTKITPSGSNYELKYQATNTGNAPFDFSIVATQMTGGVVNTLTDNASMNNVRIYADTDGNGSYTPGTDVEITYLDEVAPDDSIPVTFFIVADAPSDLNDLDIAGISVTASAKTGGSVSTEGGIITATPITDAFDPNAVQIVIANDARTVADAYEVNSAKITVVKTVTIINDPLCASPDNDYRTAACVTATYIPKAIPGATVEYTIVIANDASASASAKKLILTDNLNIDGDDLDVGVDLDTANLTIADVSINTTNLVIDDTNSSAVSSGIVTVNFEEIAVGEDATVTVQIDVN